MTAAAPLRRRLYLSSLAVAVAGLAAAALIYLTAEELQDNELVEGFHSSKTFRHEMERYGGRMSTLGDQLSSWFAGLWQGKQLGITLGCIALAVALLLFALARVAGDVATSDETGKDEP